MATIWVAELKVSAATAEKIVTKHHLTEDEVRDAVVCRRGLRVRWNDHPERGTRAIVETYIRGDRVLVVLYPRPRDAFGDVWELASAYPVGPQST